MNTLSKVPFTVQLVVFLCIFLGLAVYIVGGLEIEDGELLFLLVVLGGVVSSLRAIYLKNKLLRQRQRQSKSQES